MKSHLGAAFIQEFWVSAPPCEFIQLLSRGLLRGKQCLAAPELSAVSQTLRLAFNLR